MTRLCPAVHADGVDDLRLELLAVRSLGLGCREEREEGDGEEVRTETAGGTLDERESHEAT